MRAVLTAVRAWRERRAQRIEERTDRDELVQHWAAGGRGLAPVDRKAVPKRRRRKAVA